MAMNPISSADMMDRFANLISAARQRNEAFQASAAGKTAVKKTPNSLHTLLNTIRKNNYIQPQAANGNAGEQKTSGRILGTRFDAYA